MTEKRKCEGECGEEKPLDAEHFHSGPSGYRKVCKVCRRARELERWHEKKEEANAKRREGSQKGPWRWCLGCKRPKPLIAKLWQAEKRKTSGFRQPCKACLKKRKGKPISLDRKTES